MVWLANTALIYKRHNIEIIIKVIIDYIKIISYLISCIAKFYNTLNLTENTHVSHKSFSYS